MRTHTIITVLGLAVAAAGCDLVAGTDAGLASDEVTALSDALIQAGLSETADTSTATSLGDGLALDVVTSTTEFTRTGDCPSGGQVTMTGTRERTRDTETRTGTMDISATRTFTDCARPLADSAVTVTLNGSLTLTAHREWQAREWSGIQSIALVGRIDWATDDDRSGTCEIDVEASLDPSTRSRTVTGTVCGREASNLRGWTFGTSGQGPGYQHHNSRGTNG